MAEMTNPQLLNYLRLSAREEIGAFLLDPRPVFVLSQDGGSVLWCNESGARLMGTSDISSLLERRLAADHPSARLAARAGRTIPLGHSRMEMLRLPGAIGLTIPTSVTRIAFGQESLLRCIVDRASFSPESAEWRAKRLLACFANASGELAMLSEGGQILCASPGFAAIDSPAFRASLAMEPGAETSLIENGSIRALAVAEVADNDGPLILVFLGIAERGAQPLAPAILPTPAAPILSESAEPLPEPAAPPAQQAPASGELPEISEQQPADTADAEKILPVSPAKEPVKASPVGERSETGPVRFVFHMDRDQRFTFVSPDLAQAVGPEAADIVGKTFAEVAERLGLENCQAVANALAKRDSWSGLTLYWPVDGRDDRIALDLAALPAFGRDRSFEGFRGFGVCRPNERKSSGAPTASGLAEPASPKSSEPAAAQNAPSAPSSNVVRLSGAGERVLRHTLSGPEQDAFQRIAEMLGSSFGGRQDLPSLTDGEGGVERMAQRTAALPPTPAPIALEKASPLLPDLSLLDRLPLAILLYRKRQVLIANRALLDLTGHNSAAAFTEAGGLESLFNSEGKSWIEDAGETQSLNVRRGDGVMLPVQARLQRISLGEESAMMLTLTQSLMPDQAEAEAALATARTRIDELEGILDTATDGVVVIDPDGRILKFNRSAEALFDIEAAKAIGTPFVDLLAEESRRPALDYVDGLARNGVASVLNDGREVIGKVPRRGLIPLFMTMGRLGTSNQFCAVLRDITHWKKAEEELVTAQRAAEAANQQKSEFLAKISHEIRTPLNAVIGFSEVMMEERFGPIGNERYKEYLRDIHISGSHLMSLINDLLDLSKIEAGKVELSFDAVSVNPAIQECVALMQPQANRERIIIRTSLAPGIPSVVADARSLRQIILNLLSNAVKFTSPGGQVIVSSSLEDNGEVVLRIRDTGIGMSEKDVEAAMKPFRQLATTGRDRFNGTGLGLPLTKAMVEANRASFAIDSALDQGTVVRITFPPPRVLAG